MAFLFKSKKESNRKPLLDEKAKRYTVRTERLNNNLQGLGLDVSPESSRPRKESVWSSRILASPDSLPDIGPRRDSESPISEVDRYYHTHNLGSDRKPSSIRSRAPASQKTEAEKRLPHEINERSLSSSQEGAVSVSSMYSQPIQQSDPEKVGNGIRTANFETTDINSKRANDPVLSDRNQIEDVVRNRHSLPLLELVGDDRNGHAIKADKPKYGTTTASKERRKETAYTHVKRGEVRRTVDKGHVGDDRTITPSIQNPTAKDSWLDLDRENGPSESLKESREDMVSPRVVDESEAYRTRSTPSQLPKKWPPKGYGSTASRVTRVAALKSKGSEEGYDYVKRSQYPKDSVPVQARVKPKLQIRPVTALAARLDRTPKQDFHKPGNTAGLSRGTKDGTSEQMGAEHSGPNIIPILDKDPYIYLSHLGDGGYGVVDKVERIDQPGKVFARKRIRLKCGRLDKTLQETYREFKILKRLRHEHIISVVEVFRCQNRLFIIMEQVADTDMKEYLERLDGQEEGVERDLLRRPLDFWVCCLIEAIDYLHEMKVKHRDLKPANILIKGERVLLADFGVSKDLLDEETTTNLFHASRAGSPMYSAPETDARLQTRSIQKGRPVDIYALGCVFLEIATVLVAPPGSRARFEEFRETNGFRAYKLCPQKVLRWIWYIGSSIFRRCRDESLRGLGGSNFLPIGTPCARFAFLMLDWNPKTRITSRQLVHLLQIYLDPKQPIVVKERACSACGTGEINKPRNIPPHSTFKVLWDMYPEDPEDALKDQSISDWEMAKRQWLSQHMWW